MATLNVVPPTSVAMTLGNSSDDAICAAPTTLAAGALVGRLDHPPLVVDPFGHFEDVALIDQQARLLRHAVVMTLEHRQTRDTTGRAHDQQRVAEAAGGEDRRARTGEREHGVA